MHNPHILRCLIVMALILLLNGCAPQAPQIHQDETAIFTAAARTATFTATSTPTRIRPTAIKNAEERRQLLDPTATTVPYIVHPKPATSIPQPTITPGPTSDAPVIQAPPGLLYVFGNALFRIDPSGSPVKMLDLEPVEYPSLRPDGKHLITYIIEDEYAFDQMRLIRIRDGHRQDLPKGYVLCFPRDVPQKPEMLVGNWNDRNDPESGDPGYRCSGVPGSYNIHNQSLTLLNKGLTSYYPVSVSPDGNMLAFDQGIYTWGRGFREVDLEAYGLEEELSIFAPAFSHSGEKIAWLYRNSGTGEMGILILDLVQQTHTRLPGYNTIWFENIAPEVKWLPDDRQLFMYYYEDYPSNDYRYWLVPVDGKKATEFDSYLYWEFSPDRRWAVVRSNHGRGVIAVDGFLANLSKPLVKIPTRIWHWSPDSRWLALTDHNWNREEEEFLIEAGQWKLWKLDLPRDAVILGWEQ
jgi:hypothetical protein